MTHKTTEPKPTQSSTQSPTIDPNQILGGITAVEWEKLGNDDKPPKVTLKTLCAGLPATDTAQILSVIDRWDEPPVPPVDAPNYASHTSWYCFDRCARVHRQYYPSIHDGQIRGDALGAMLRLLVFSLDLDINDADINAIHRLWGKAVKHDSSLTHPLAPIVQAWLHDKIPRVEPSRRIDTGVLPDKARHTYPLQGELPMELEKVDYATSEIGSFPPGEIQGVLPFFESPKSEIVPALPLVAYEVAGGKTKRQGRGAPIEQRLFVNLLLEFVKKSPHETVRLNTTYRDIRQWLYPHGTRETKKTLIPKLQKAFLSLHNLFFEWDRRAWNIVSVHTLPTLETKPDDMLTFFVRMPDGMQTGGGARLELQTMREYGANSAPCFRAWVRLAYIWDAAKPKNGGRRIYATVPEVLRDTDDFLTDAKGQRILTGDLYNTENGWAFRQGSVPQRAWYHPLAVTTGRQIRNPQADKVPILTDEDLVKLFYDHTPREGGGFWKALHDAKKQMARMEKDGNIVVEPARCPKAGMQGHRILEPYPKEGNAKLSSG